MTSGTFAALGVRVDAVQIPDVIRQMETWIERDRSCHSVVFANLHGISEAREDEGIRTAMNGAALVVADGMPLVWLGRLRGHPMPRRVYGP